MECSSTRIGIEFRNNQSIGCVVLKMRRATPFTNPEFCVLIDASFDMVPIDDCKYTNNVMQTKCKAEIVDLRP